MKKLAFCAFGLGLILASCEKEEFDKIDSSNPINVEEHNGGVKITLKSSSGVATSVTKGAGFACSYVDSFSGQGISFYGIATGDSVLYDPVLGAIYSSDPNEVPLTVGWVDTTGNLPGVGTYQGGDFLTGEINGREVFADGSLLTINVTALTNDSLKGNFSGPIEEMTLTLDTVNQIFTVTPTGIFDTISGAFAVERAPCF